MLKKLQQRQFQNANPGSNLSRNRELHSNIVPNETFFDIALPQLNIRKFTPCGRYLVTFSKQQHSISLFSYLGLKASDSDPGDVWNKLFLLKYETNLTFGSELLCKDFCLFTTNCKYVYFI